ncbi:MAG: hypothetical protein K2N56_07210 [Oscillospiraceae bacterium]|nr:hypothetical protein [Oscillospiraceae bacterium]
MLNNNKYKKIVIIVAAVAAVVLVVLFATGKLDGILNDIQTDGDSYTDGADIDSTGDLSDNISGGSADGTSSSSDANSSTSSAKPQSSSTSSAVSSSKPQSSSTSSAASSSKPSSSVSEPQLRFRNKNLLNQHYQKHGIDMGFSSAEEYEKAAARVPYDPNVLHKIEAEDGDDVYYIESTNEFVIVSTDGYLRTYFNPDRGIDYFNRQ